MALATVAALVAVPVLSTAADADVCGLQADCDPLTLYFHDVNGRGELGPGEPDEASPSMVVLGTNQFFGPRFALRDLGEDVPLHPNSAITFRLHRDAVGVPPDTQLVTQVILTEIDTTTWTRTVMLDETVRGVPDMHPDALTATGRVASPAAEGYEAFSIPTSRMDMTALRSGFAYEIEFRLGADKPTLGSIVGGALETASCTPGWTLNPFLGDVYPGRDCLISSGNLGTIEDVLYYGSASHPSRVTLPVAVMHTT